MNGETGKKWRGKTTRVLVCVMCLVLLGPSIAAGGNKKTQKQSKKETRIQLLQQLPIRWRIWLDEEIYPLITKEQRQAVQGEMHPGWFRKYTHVAAQRNGIAVVAATSSVDKSLYLSL